MATTPQVYTKMSVFLKDILISEQTSCSIDSKSGNQVVNTVEKGFAGISPGSASTAIKIETAVPRKGCEVDFHAIKAAKEVVELVGIGRDVTIKSQGFIMDISESYGADKAASLTIDFMGTEIEETAI